MVAFTTTAVGESLRDQRAASGLTLGEAAFRCSIPLTYLLKIEAGSSGPTAELLRQLIRLYGLAPDGPMFEGDQRRPTREECEIDWVGLVKTASSRTNLELLEEVAVGIRALRSFGEATPVIMREIEADIMITLLDLSDPHLLVDIMCAFSLSAVQVDEFLAASVRRFDRRSIPTDSIIVERIQAAPAAF
jgi:transcriptional regulator with XRE-family HTH domain